MWSELNITVFHMINGYATKSRALDNLVVEIASHAQLIPIFLVVSLFFLKKTRCSRLACLSIYSALLAMTLNAIIRHLFFHPRPFMLKLGIQLIRHAPTTSFPSAHTTFMLSIALIWLYFRDSRKVGVLLFMVGVMGGLARVFCGIHFPLDIAGSFLVALSASSLVFIWRNRLNRFSAWIALQFRGVRGYLGFKVT